MSDGEQWSTLPMGVRRQADEPIDGYIEKARKAGRGPPAAAAQDPQQDQLGRHLHFAKVSLADQRILPQLSSSA